MDLEKPGVNTKKALWVGRFQPPTAGHLIALFAILSKYPECLIGIVYRTRQPDKVPEEWKQYLKDTETILESAGRNPFSAEEVQLMWMEILVEFNIVSRVTLVIMPRIPYQGDFNQKYPIDAFDFVDIDCDSEDPTSDHTRQNAFRSYLGRPITIIKSPFKVRASAIREMIARGDQEWRGFIPKSIQNRVLNTMKK